MAQKFLDITGGRKLPSVGLGTFTATDESQLEAAIDAALETGYRHIDTAYFYDNEHIIGRVLKKWFESGKLKREEVFVTTKLPGCQSPHKVEKFLNLSLEKLQLDSLDLYLIHVPLNFKIQPGQSLSAVTSEIELEPSDIVATWKKLEEQVDLGRIKSIGVSNFNKDQVRRILEVARIIPAANQVELHVYLQQPELVRYCQDNGVAIVSYQSLGNPGLPDQYKNLYPLRQFPDLLNDPVVKKIGSKHGKSTAQVLLRFLIEKSIAVIPKSVTPSRIKENFNLFDFTLDSTDIRELESLDKGAEGRITWMNFNKAVLSDPEYPFGTLPLSLVETKV